MIYSAVLTGGLPTTSRRAYSLRTASSPGLVVPWYWPLILVRGKKTQNGAAGVITLLTAYLANFLSQFETIYVLNNGLITHQAGYHQLLSEGLVIEETMADLESPVSARDSDKAAEVSCNPADEVDEEDKNKQAPSDWSVYAYFFQSCGLAGVSLFFFLAAALAAERSFESKSAPPQVLRLRPCLPLTVRARRLAQNVG